MAKVIINGERFDYDAARKPLFEALEIERTLKCRFADWENELITGDQPTMRSLAAFAWIVLHRDGRDVTLEDILSGKHEVNLNDLTIEPDAGAADPADPTNPPPDPSPTTGSGTSARSRKSSA